MHKAVISCTLLFFKHSHNCPNVNSDLSYCSEMRFKSRVPDQYLLTAGSVSFQNWLNFNLPGTCILMCTVNITFISAVQHVFKHQTRLYSGSITLLLCNRWVLHWWSCKCGTQVGNSLLTVTDYADDTVLFNGDVSERGTVFESYRQAASTMVCFITGR